MFKIFKIIKCKHDYHIVRTERRFSLMSNTTYAFHTVYCPKCDFTTEKSEIEWGDYVKIKAIKEKYVR